MVTGQQVGSLLAPWLGSALLQARPQIVREVSRRLNAYVPVRDSAATLRSGLEGLLRATVLEATEGDLRIMLDDGSVVRMEEGDFPILADELMYLVFEQFPTDAHHLMLLRDFSLRENSLSAVRTLYTRFSDYETLEEKRALAKIAREAHPAFRWKSWLTGPENE